jgi:hypothetical protein
LFYYLTVKETRAVLNPNFSMNAQIETCDDAIAPGEKRKWVLNGKLVTPTELKDVKMLGRGAFGTVHKSIMTNSLGEQIEVAVKRMHPDLVRDSPLEVKNFIEECRMMATFNHRQANYYLIVFYVSFPRNCLMSGQYIALLYHLA